MDTSVFINASHPDEKGARASKQLLLQVQSGRRRSIISTITTSELLNGAYRVGGPAVTRMKRDLEAYKSAGSLIAPLTEDVADKVGELCAKYAARIRPDVIIVASALRFGAAVVVTRDLEHFSAFQREIPILKPEAIIGKTRLVSG